MQSIGRDHPLRLHFAGLIENAFCAEVGMCDPQLTDYLADLLVDFTHIDRLKALRRTEGKELDQIASMLIAMSDDIPNDWRERDRSMYRQIGDYTLFWAGMFPEHLRRQSPRPTDILLDYVTRGKKSYAIVSDLVAENEAPPPSLFRHLSEDFEFCLYGLGLVRRGCTSLGPSGRENGGDLLR